MDYIFWETSCGNENVKLFQTLIVLLAKRRKQLLLAAKQCRHSKYLV